MLYGSDLEFVFRTRSAWHETHYAANKNKSTEQRQLLDAHRAQPNTRRPRGKKPVPAGFRPVSHSANEYTCDVIFASEGDIIDGHARPQFAAIDEPSMAQYTGAMIEALLLLGMRPSSRISRPRGRRTVIEKRAAPTLGRQSTKRRTSAVSPAESLAALVDDETVLCEGGLAQPVAPVDPLAFGVPMQPPPLDSLAFGVPVQSLPVDPLAVESHVILAHAANLGLLIADLSPPSPSLCVGHADDAAAPSSPSSFFNDQPAHKEAAAAHDNDTNRFIDFDAPLVDKSTADETLNTCLAIGLTGATVGFSMQTEQFQNFLASLELDLYANN
jgi:hypothetical protein